MRAGSRSESRLAISGYVSAVGTGHRKHQLVRGAHVAGQLIREERVPMNTTTITLLPTSLVGSYAQPDWLINREMLGKQMPPRVRALELWRVAPEWLEQAQDDATLVAIRDQEQAGIDIVTDGEARRESYSHRFATALDGLDLDHPAT